MSTGSSAFAHVVGIQPFDADETTEVVDGVHLSLLAGEKRLNVQGFAIESGGVVLEHSHVNEQVGVVYPPRRRRGDRRRTG